MAKIKTVSFRSNVTVKPFHAVHIEVSADVGPREKPERVLEELKRWVAQQLRLVKGATPRPKTLGFLGMLEDQQDEIR